MDIQSRLTQLIELATTRGAVSAYIGWPKFSLASYKIVSRMVRGGVYPKTVIDVGANLGQFAVAASRLFAGANVFPIEPDPDIAIQLRRNVGQRIAQNVMVTAIGDTVGEADFFVNRDSQVSSLLKLGSDREKAFPKSTVERTRRVPVTTLDMAFACEKLAPPILLKIDVQGFEDRVIAGAGQLLASTEWVLMELSFADLYQGEQDFGSLTGLLAQSGFVFQRPLNFHVSPKVGDIIEMDALFVRNRGGRTVGDLAERKE